MRSTRSWCLVVCLAMLAVSEKGLGQQSPGPALGWVAARPDLVLGANELDATDDLFRVTGVAQFEDGLIAVVNNGTREVIYFDQRGRVLRRAGGEGDGPSELRGGALVPLERYDSLFVSNLPRLSVAHSDGRIDRVGQMPVPFDFVGPLGRQLALVAHGGDMIGPGETGLRRSWMHFHVTDRIDRGGRQIASVEYVRHYKSTPSRSSVLPLTVVPSYAISRGRLLVTDGVSPEVRVVTASGQEHAIALPLQARAVTRRDMARALGEVPPERRRRLEGAPPPERYPLVDRLLPDPAGGFWVRLFQEDERASSRWLIIDEEEKVLGVLTLPAGFALWQVGKEFVLGVRKDDWDVERVERYQLRRDSRPAAGDNR